MGGGAIADGDRWEDGKGEEGRANQGTPLPPDQSQSTVASSSSFALHPSSQTQFSS